MSSFNNNRLFSNMTFQDDIHITDLFEPVKNLDLQKRLCDKLAAVEVEITARVLLKCLVEQKRITRIHENLKFLRKFFLGTQRI